MGRAKLNMELISKEKTRNITYQKRKSGLLKKAYEFTTLCDVSACVIIYGPNSREPEIWPPNHDEVKRVLSIYKDKRSECAKRTFDLSDFFEDRKKKIEDELAKARRRNMEAKYPTWFDFLNNLNEVQLREFANVLDNKLEVVKNRIDLLKGNSEFFPLGFENMNKEYFQGPPLGLESKNRVELAKGDNVDYFQGLPLGLGQSGLDLENKIDDHFNVPIYPPVVDQGHLTCPINPSPMMMVMMSDNDYGNFNGASCSNVQYAPFNRDLCYDDVCGMIESTHVVYNNPNPMPLMRYYAPPTTLQPLPAPFMQCTLMSSVSSQVNKYDDGVDAHADAYAYADYQMSNKRGRFN